MRGNFMKRLLCVILVIAMVTAYAAPVYAADSGTVSFRQVDNNRVSATLTDRESVVLPEEEAPYADTDVVRVSIVLEKAGTIGAGFSALNIAQNTAAMNYRGKVETDQAAVTARIEKATGKDLDVVWNLTLAANIISANVEFGRIPAIEQVAGVKSVLIENRYEPDVVSTGAADPNMATSGHQIGSSAVWAAGYTGAGSRIAVIDTGADIEHEAFDAAAFEYSIEQLGTAVDLMDADDIAAVLSRLNAYKRTGFSAEDLYVNAKVPFGFNYIDEDLDIVHVNDYQGEHGSHVAGIATANAYVSNGDGTFAPSLNTTFVQGVAPDAQLLVMKVFGKNGGAYDSDYMAAIEDAVLLGADAVNLSLGSGNPGMSRVDDEYAAIMENLEKSGVVVAMSAGNAGFWSEAAENGLPYLYRDDVSFQTNGFPGSYTNALTVASVDNDGFTTTYFEVDGSVISYADSQGYGNDPMTTLAGSQEYVLVDSIGQPADFEAIGIENLEGKIVMCYRGSTSFFEKANAAASMGAAGVVIVNNQEGTINMDLTGYEYTVPVVAILQSDGEIFKAAGTAHTTESGITYWTGSMEVSDSLGCGQYGSEYYTMSSFSSWGVPGSLELKPEITAPGGNIYSVAGAIYDGTFSNHRSYETMSGTSMASPQVAGMAALMVQYVRESGLTAKTGLDERTLTQSLLMSTAVPLRDSNSGGNYYPVIQQGAGLANVGNAVNADSYIIMGEDATASWADGKVKAELGDDPARTGVYSFSFTIHNLTGEAKELRLSADVFTQDAFNDFDVWLLDTWTANLTPAVAWAVNGKAVGSSDSLEGLDFNGDGTVDTADGQILLDYATGLDVTLSNTGSADLNGDGEINSYDAYLVFSRLNSGDTTLPANGSAEVTVTITLSREDKNRLASYENGAYIEAYVCAQTVSTDEGVAGTAHSIPMLAYYGNWSDPSMFDKGSAMEFNAGLETRPPYLYNSTYANGNYNGLLIKYADKDGEYWFGGNPVVTDEIYMPERNAISIARGDYLSRIGFTAIRNAADSYFRIANTKKVYMNESLGEVMSAYYYTNGGYWVNTYYTKALGIQPDVEENTSVEVGLTLVPEYYVDDDGNVNLDALGGGATFSMPMVIDNTAPTVNDVDIDTAGNVMTVSARDNQYIAAVALYDIYGEYLYTHTGSDAGQSAGDTVQFTLDLADVNGPRFLLQVYDYAMNTTTYEITTQIGEVTDTLERIELDKTALTMQKGDTAALTAVVYPVNASDRSVVWSSSDETVVSVAADGTLTANALGTATVTAAAAADAAMTASCTVEVIDIAAGLNAIVWDEDGAVWFSEFSAGSLPDYTKLSPDMQQTDTFVSAAVGADGTLYASSLNPSNLSGTLYTVDPDTYQTEVLTDIIVQDLLIFYADLTYAPAMLESGALLGVYGPYVIAIDPLTGEALGVIDELGGDLVGIATGGSLLDVAEDGTIVYQDQVYLIQSDGTVIQEIYYGYDGQVVPYNDYFYGERVSFDAGVDVGSAWYFNSAYYDGSFLYWSAFDESSESAVTLYAIDADNSGDVYTMGRFAEGVWPVGGLHDLDASAVTAASLADVNRKITTVDEIQLVARDFPVQEAQTGGLNAVAEGAAPVSPLSVKEIDCGDNRVYVNVTALDESGAEVTSTNGVQTITYDPKVLTLAEVDVKGDYVSVNETEGSVTIGYVSMDGIGYDFDYPTATLIFDIVSSQATEITVTHEEVNDQKPGYVESMKVYADDPHGYEFNRFEHAEDFSWAEAVYSCFRCGHERRYDAEIAYEVKQQPTCTEAGFAWYTISYGEEFQVIPVDVPATGHLYENGVCTGCGEADPDYKPAVVITAQPADYVGQVGDMASFAVTAEGEDLTYQWYFSADNGETWEKSSCKTSTLNIEFKAYRLNYLYYCVVTDGAGNTATTDIVKLTAQETELVIVTQPVSYAGAVNDEVTFTVEAVGNGLVYEWFFSGDGGVTWAKSYSPGYQTNTLAPILRSHRDGNMYKCVVSDVFGNSVESDAVSMTVKASDIIIVTQPSNVENAVLNQLYTFTVEAEGDNLTYRWQVSTDGGETWEDSWNQGYNSATLSVRMNANRDGNLYRCVITSGLKTVVTSDAAVLDMQDASARIVSQSGNVSVIANQTATFTVEAEGSNLTYLWYRSNDKGATWSQTYLSGYNTDTLSFVANTNRAAMYMCKVTDGSGTSIWSEPVKLQILSAELKILTQPVSITCGAGETATFTVEAQGDTLKYQWYASADGETWTASYLTGYNTSEFSFTVNTARAAKLYKCVITDAGGNTVETNPVSVTIG